MRTSNKFFI